MITLGLVIIGAVLGVGIGIGILWAVFAVLDSREDWTDEW